MTLTILLYLNLRTMLENKTFQCQSMSLTESGDCVYSSLHFQALSQALARNISLILLLYTYLVHKKFIKRSWQSSRAATCMTQKTAMYKIRDCYYLTQCEQCPLSGCLTVSWCP